MLNSPPAITQFTDVLGAVLFVAHGDNFRTRCWLAGRTAEEWQVILRKLLHRCSIGDWVNLGGITRLPGLTCGQSLPHQYTMSPVSVPSLTDFTVQLKRHYVTPGQVDICLPFAPTINIISSFLSGVADNTYFPFVLGCVAEHINIAVAHPIPRLVWFLDTW